MEDKPFSELYLKKKVKLYLLCGKKKNLDYIRKNISQFLKKLKLLFSYSHLEEKTQWEHPKSGKRKRVAGGLC